MCELRVLYRPDTYKSHGKWAQSIFLCMVFYGDTAENAGDPSAPGWNSGSRHKPVSQSDGCGLSNALGLIANCASHYFPLIQLT